MLIGSRDNAPHPRWDTLMEMFHATASAHPQRGIYVIGEDGGREWRTYAQLLEESYRMGAALQAAGFGAADRIVIMMRTGYTFIAAFFGCVAIGAHPIPLAPPRHDHPNPYASMKSLSKFAARMGARGVLFDDDLPVEQRPTAGPTSNLESALSAAQLLERATLGARPDAPETPSPVAYIQPTSGSTGPVRAVALTHRNVLTSVAAAGLALKVDAEDMGQSWLPLDNIMGLVGFVLLPMYWGIDVALMPPQRFLDKPAQWLWAIHQHRATLTSAPNFAYHYCVRRCRERDLEGLDLSSLRVAMNGGEPVRARHIKAFVQRFAPYGLAQDVFLPVYGLSEGTLGLTFAPLDDRLHTDAIDQHALEQDGIARALKDPQSVSRARRMHLVSVGEPLPCVDIKVVDAAGTTCDARELGHIAFRGANVMHGYVEEVSDVLRHRDRFDVRCLRDGWWITEDLGYIAEGRLYVLDRATDTPRDRWGRLHFPSEVELVVNAIDGVRPGSAVAFLDGSGEDEEFVVALEVQMGAPAEEIREEVVRQCLTRHNIRPDRIVILSPFSVPKTRDGKVRRRMTRQLWRAGKLELRARTGEFAGVVRLLNRARSDVLRATTSLRDTLTRWLTPED